MLEGVRKADDCYFLDKIIVAMCPELIERKMYYLWLIVIYNNRSYDD